MWVLQGIVSCEKPQQATAVLALWDAALRTWQWKEEILFTLSISPGLLYISRGLGGPQDRGLRLIANQEITLLGNQILNCAPSLCSGSHKLQQYMPVSSCISPTGE